MNRTFFRPQRIAKHHSLPMSVLVRGLLSLILGVTASAVFVMPIHAAGQSAVGAPIVAMACDFMAADETTLAQAIDCVNLASSGSYTIEVTADIALTAPLHPITNTLIDQLVIAGNGHTIDAQGHGRVLTLTNVQNLTLRDLTLTGGMTDLNSGARGGGAAFYCDNDLVCNWMLLNTVVTNNQAYDGGGIDYYCGYHGNGALIVQDSVISANEVASQGGGIMYSSDEESGPCSMTLRNTLVEGNQAIDGGGIRIYRPRVTISTSTIRNNVATEFGGGIVAQISDGFIDMNILRSTISGNRAGESGGGVYIASPDQTFDIKFVNSTISGNTVDSGAGGGLYLRERGGSLQIALINSTITQNAANQGAGVHIFDLESPPSYYTSTLRLNNSIIADNLTSDCTGEAAPGVVFTGQRIISYGHNLDSDGSCLPPEVRQASDIPNGDANLGPLADNGGDPQGTTFTHALRPGSQAIDAGDDAVCAAEPVGGVDQRGVARPQGAHCDIGAYETAAQPEAITLLFVSSRSSAMAGEVAFRDEDIVAYDFTTGIWQMVFDGSDVGITKDVNAFTFLTDGTLLLSFNGPTVVPGLGAADDSDIVQFIPTRLGSDTAGSFGWYLHGAEVGLSSDGEDIDALGFTPEGQLVVSTIGSLTTPDVSGRDEDLFTLDNATFGTPSSGVWQLFFDGSQVGLANEDIDGLWIDPATGESYFTVKDGFAFAEVQVDSDDIFVCMPTQTGSCTYRLFWDGDGHDYGGENLDAIELGVLPATFTPGGQVEGAEALRPEAIAEDDDIDDIDIEAADNTENLLNNIFLPFP